MSCSLCEIRKEKRFCPAVHGRICSQCCGEQREVTLDCPTDCPYLRQAREHEKPRETSELDRAVLFPEVEIEEAFLYRREHLLMGLTFALAKSARSDKHIADRDLITTLSTLAKSYETLVNSGLHYETAVTNPVQQAIAAELQKMLTEFREVEQKNLGYTTLRDSEILKALVFLVRMAYGRTSARPKSRAYVEFLFSQFPEKPGSVVTPDQAESRIIVP